MKTTWVRRLSAVALCVFLPVLGVGSLQCGASTTSDPQRQGVRDRKGAPSDASSAGSTSPPAASPSASLSVAAASAAPTASERADGSSCVALASVPPTTDAEDLDRRFRCIQRAMTRDQVRGLIGPPELVRRRASGDGSVVEIWQYSGKGDKGSVAVGKVKFDSSNVVIATEREGGRHRPVVHRGARAVPSPEGMLCVLQGVSWGGEVVRARVALRNNGKKVFRFKHDHTAIKFNLLVMLFDDQGVLIGDQDLLMLHSPFGSSVELVIPPGGEQGENVTFLGVDGEDFASLAPGRYALQVAFPLAGYEYYASDRVPFVVPKGPAKPFPKGKP